MAPTLHLRTRHAEVLNVERSDLGAQANPAVVSQESILQTIYVSKRLQRLAQVDSPGLVNFVPAVAYHFCLSLPAT